MATEKPASKLTVLQLHNKQRGYGGADIVLERENKLLQGHGHKVISHFTKNNDFEDASKLTMATNAIWNRQIGREIDELVERERPDIAHVHTPYPLMSPAVFRALKRHRLPVVYTMHSYRNICINGLLYRDGQRCHDCLGKTFSLPGVKHGCYRNSKAASFSMAASLALHRMIGTFRNDVDVYISLTEFGRNRFIEGGLPEDKIMVKGNFVTSDVPVGDGKGGYALFVGRFTEEKGITALLDGWTQLQKIPLKIVGDGPLADEVKEKIADFPHIEFCGWQEQPVVREMMQSASAIVFPSEWYEAGPTLVMIEAFQVGTPVIASDLGNFSEVIDTGKTGYLFKVGDGDDLAKVAQEAFANPELGSTMRQRCRDLYESTFTAEPNYKRLMEIYRQAFKRSGSKLNTDFS